MSTPVFALIDCNNFFASCERLFKPNLKNRPVAVLSNNDGCIVARSNEVKALGIKMGEPYFRREALLKAHKAEVFSANFTLYGDISDRVVEVLKRESPKIEVYSIDESFLQIDNLGIHDYDKWAKHLAAKVEKEVGVPVSIGVAPTKTLAKLATEKAKKTPELRGGLSLVDDKAKMEEALKWLDIEDIWGIGRRRAPMLRKMGLKTAFDMTGLKDEWVLKNMTITGLRTVRELRGESCIPLDDYAMDYQQKMVSATRSFGKKVRGYGELESAVATFCARASMRLRRKDQLAWSGSLFLRAYMPDRTHRYASCNFRLIRPSAFTGDVIKGAHQALMQLHDKDMRYDKGGVILSSLVDQSAQQMTLFDDPKKQTELFQKQDSLMTAVDKLTVRYGKGLVMFASEKPPSGKWHSKRNRVSPMYTTRWEHVPKVKRF